jgi:hypothetical protein
MFRRLIPCLLVPLLLLSACGDLPEPFLGNPGANARRLARPLSPMLAVPFPGNAMLSDPAGHALAESLAGALQGADVPALAREPRTNDWRLITSAEQRGRTVVPIYLVQNPEGVEQGTTEGSPVPTEAWAASDNATLNAVAAEAAGKVADLLTSIRVARDKADPNSLYNRVPKVMVADVTGAPGDGNVSLTRQMRAKLAAYGPLIQTSPSGADFIVKGKVVAVALPNRQQRIEIQWYVNTPNGDERGRVIQLNEIPAGTLDRFWGDVAVVVAAEASAGINDVLNRQSGREPPRGEAVPVQPEPSQGAAAARN